MRLYEPPAKEFFRLPNSIFHVPLDATQFKLYAYLVCCSGSKEYCWPTHKKIIQDSVSIRISPSAVSFSFLMGSRQSATASSPCFTESIHDCT